MYLHGSGAGATKGSSYLSAREVVLPESLKHWQGKRRDRDSNPSRTCALTGFRNRRLQPLSHLSGLRPYHTVRSTTIATAWFIAADTGWPENGLRHGEIELAAPNIRHGVLSKVCGQATDDGLGLGQQPMIHIVIQGNCPHCSLNDSPGRLQ